MIFKEFSPAFKNVKIFHSSDIKITFSEYYFRNVKKSCSITSENDKRLPIKESNSYVLLKGINIQKI